MGYQRATRPLKLDGLDATRAFFAGCFAESDPAQECLWVAHVDADANCIHVSRHDGDASKVGFPIREIVMDVTARGSSGLILAHNHPSGDPLPSPSDYLATRRLAAIAEGLNCKIVDHVILGGAEWSSFRDLGLL